MTRVRVGASCQPIRPKDRRGSLTRLFDTYARVGSTRHTLVSLLLSSFRAKRKDVVELLVDDVFAFEGIRRGFVGGAVETSSNSWLVPWWDFNLRDGASRLGPRFVVRLAGFEKMAVDLRAAKGPPRASVGSRGGSPRELFVHSTLIGFRDGSSRASPRYLLSVGQASGRLGRLIETPLCRPSSRRRAPFREEAGAQGWLFSVHAFALEAGAASLFLVQSWRAFTN